MKKSSILIADSGSTKTDWLLIKDADSVFQFQSAGFNPFYQDRKEITDVLEKEVLMHVSDHVDRIFFYGAGCADEISGKPVIDALKTVFPTIPDIQVASDMLGAARGLCGHEAGIACILGTGANNAFYDGQKIVKSIGSLGFWLGDEGSGSYLGKTLVVHFLQNELPEALHNAFSEAYPEINRLSVLEHAYRKPFPNRYFAGFAKFIAAHILHDFITQMVESAFDLFVKKYILKHADAEKLPINFTGSVAFYFQNILKNSLEKKNLKAGNISKSPILKLAEYHLPSKS